MEEMVSVAENSRLLSIKDAASYLGLRPAFLYELTYQGGIPFVRIGGRKLIKVADLDKLITENTHCAQQGGLG